MSNDKKFILIDFDETLVLSPVGGYEGFEELREEFGFPDDYTERLKAHEEKHLADYTDRQAVIESARDERAHHEEYYRALGRALGFRWRTLKKYVTRTVDRRMKDIVFTEIDGIRDTLENWKKEGYMRIIFSNAFLSREGLIKRMGLDAYVDGSILSPQAGAAKPDTAMYAYALEKYDLEAKNGWIVDNEVENIQAFQKMGGQGAVVDMHQKEPEKMNEGIRTINHIRELL